MKNRNYFPMERNHYYYGKLLTVEDFELEQQYMNNKRRIINRYLYGSGVVRGLDIIQVDERTLSLETGLAIDYTGREIMVEKPVSLKLSDIEGFYDGSEEELPYAYLCIAYQEEGQEAVHNAAGAQDGEQIAYNKWREGYRLYLTRNEPGTGAAFSDREFYQERQICFQENGIRITHWLPRYVKAGTGLELLVEVENLGQQQDFAFSYEVRLQCLKSGQHTVLQVDFDEHLVKKELRYCLRYPLTALESEEAQGILSIKEDSFRLSIGGRGIKAKAAGISRTRISSRPAWTALLADYRSTGLETVLDAMAGCDIYLAKILFLRAGNTFVIQETEKMPFEQYVWSNGLNTASRAMLEKELTAAEPNLMAENSPAAEPGPEWVAPVRFGREKITLEKGAKSGSIFFSEEIVHGLGPGEVCIYPGKTVISEQKEIIYGKEGIFRSSTPKMDLAVKVNPETGTFIIGVKLLEALRTDSCTICWTGWKNPEQEEKMNHQKEIIINPAIVTLKTRETRYLEAICKNMIDKRLKWQTEKDGGIIDANGMYTAPHRPGVYEVTVSSMAYPDVETSVYIVVR